MSIMKEKINQEDGLMKKIHMLQTILNMDYDEVIEVYPLLDIIFENDEDEKLKNTMIMTILRMEEECKSLKYSEHNAKDIHGKKLIVRKYSNDWMKIYRIDEYGGRVRFKGGIYILDEHDRITEKTYNNRLTS